MLEPRKTARLGLSALGCLQCAVLIGCVEPQPDLATATQGVAVGDYVDSSGCTTSVVLPLSEQIAEEIECIMPGLLVPFEEGDGIVFSGTVLPWIDAEARADLLAAAAEGELQVTSAYRTVAQQYLLYAWWQAGKCGITAAATPGTSNHESGRAVDLSNWANRVSSMSNHGWAHDVPGDDVHFDHLSSPDYRGSDVLAFQRLWNRANPGMPIDEDGDWGPMTEMALAASPAEGFATGTTCAGGGDPPPDHPPGSNEGGNDGNLGDATGGCAAGGGGGSLALGVLALGLITVRRRSRLPASTPRRR